MNNPARWNTDVFRPDMRREVVVLGVMAALALVGLAITSPGLALAASLAGAVFAVGTYSTSFAVGCVLLSVPVQDHGAIPIGGADLTITKVVVGGALLAWLYRALADPGFLRLDATTVAFAAIVLALLASIAAARNIDAWAGEVYRWAVAFAVYLMAISAMRDRRYRAVLVAASALGVIAVSMIGYWQVLTGAGPPSFESRGLTRAYATFGEPNPFAGYLEMTVPLLASVTLFGWRRRAFGHEATGGRRLSLLAAGATGCGGIALLLTQSRGGLLAVLASVLVIAIAYGGWMRWAAIGGIVLAVAVLAASPLGSRFAAAAFGGAALQQVSPETFAVQERVAHWRTGIAMVQEHPLFGVGAGNFSERYREFAQVWRFRISRGHAHNTYIHLAAQSGLVGLACYLGLLGTVTWRLIAAYRRRAAAFDRALIVGVLGVTAAVAVHGLFDYLHVLSLGLQLSAVWALTQLDGGAGREPET